MRTVYGRMIDTALDIRKDSPTFGKIVAYDLPASTIKIIMNGSGFRWDLHTAHFFLNQRVLNIDASGKYSPKCEVGISPLASDIDWSLCDVKLKSLFDSIVPHSQLLSEKDKHGLTLAAWKNDPRSDHFVYSK